MIETILGLAMFGVMIMLALTLGNLLITFLWLILAGIVWFIRGIIEILIDIYFFLFKERL